MYLYELRLLEKLPGAGKSSGTSLLPQEKALLYVILEVAVCLTVPTPG